MSEKESKMIQFRPFKKNQGGSPLGGQWKEKEKVIFHLFSLFPQATLLKPSSFSLLYHGYRSLFTSFLLFPWPINCDCAFWCHKSPIHSLSIWFGWRFVFSLEIMALRMATSYGLQAGQANEEPSSESVLDLTLTQHPHDEEPESWEVHARLEVNPPQAW
jgi:hypothetical protein